MKICGIYKITSPYNKIYIGQSIDIFARFNKYKKNNCKGQVRLYRSFQTHGVDKHKFEILCQCDKSELNNLESYYIELFQCFNSEYGLNLASGGNANKIVSDETKKKMSASGKKKVFSSEHKGNISKSKKGNKAFFGKHHTKESRLKMSISKKGKSFSDEHKQKLSITRKGCAPNNGSFKKGELPWNKGKSGYKQPRNK